MSFQLNYPSTGKLLVATKLIKGFHGFLMGREGTHQYFDMGTLVNLHVLKATASQIRCIRHSIVLGDMTCHDY